MVERLVIDHVGHRGDGVVDSGAEPIFVFGALPGETVEVESIPGHPDRRQLLRVDTPSAERIAPICPHFGICGGCAVQHWQTERYRAWKRDLVVTALRRAGIAAPVGDLIDAHGDGRRRAVFHARRGGRDILEVGFSAARAHHVIAIDRCPVLAQTLDGALQAAWAIAEVLVPAKKPLDIQVTATDSGLDVDVRGSGALSAALTAALARVAAAHSLARLTRHGEMVAQQRVPTLRIGKATVALPPAAFLQATAAGEAALARLALAYCAGAQAVADLGGAAGHVPGNSRSRRISLPPSKLKRARAREGNRECSGWAGIRTPGAFRHTRFPGVHNRPLCHPSQKSAVKVVAAGTIRRAAVECR